MSKGRILTHPGSCSSNLFDKTVQNVSFMLTLKRFYRTLWGYFPPWSLTLIRNCNRNRTSSQVLLQNSSAPPPCWLTTNNVTPNKTRNKSSGNVPSYFGCFRCESWLIHSCGSDRLIDYLKVGWRLAASSGTNVCQVSRETLKTRQTATKSDVTRPENWSLNFEICKIINNKTGTKGAVLKDYGKKKDRAS